MKELILGGESIITGRGALDQLRSLEARRAFIVTGGSSMITSGVIARVEAILAEKGCVTKLHAGVPANPDTEVVLAGVAAMRQFAPDCVVAVGGGSAMDAAKVMTLFYEYPELNFAAAIAGELPVRRKGVRLVAVPSTSGTGSEVTKAAVVTFRDRDFKIGLRTPAFIPDMAILDPELTMTMPPNVVAETGMDALTHAVECYVNRGVDDFTAVMAEGAVAGLFEYLPLSYSDKNLESREKVHNYQCLAGLAFSNVGLGAAHGIAHAFGGMFGLGHGLLNAIVLPYVIEYNARDAWVRGQVDRLARRVGAADFAQAVRELGSRIGIPASIRAAGVSDAAFAAALPQLVANSLEGPTRVNPVAFTPTEMEGLIKRMFTGQ